MAIVRHIRPNKERPPETLIEAEGCKVHITEGRMDAETKNRFTTIEIIMKEGWEYNYRKVDNITVTKVIKANSES